MNETCARTFRGPLGVAVPVDIICGSWDVSLRNQAKRIRTAVDTSPTEIRVAIDAGVRFLADPSMRRARHFERVLIKLSDHAEVGVVADDLSATLAQFRPEGGEGLYDRGSIAPRVRVALLAFRRVKRETVAP